MDTTTAAPETVAWYVSDRPSVDDVTVSCMATAATAAHDAPWSNWTVVRVNHHTGRGTVQHRETGTKLQVVRGRFGWWRLADGTSRPVRFAHPVPAPVDETERRFTDDGVELFGDDVTVEAPMEWPISAE